MIACIKGAARLTDTSLLKPQAALWREANKAQWRAPEVRLSLFLIGQDWLTDADTPDSTTLIGHQRLCTNMQQSREQYWERCSLKKTQGSRDAGEKEVFSQLLKKSCLDIFFDHIPISNCLFLYLKA